VTQLVTGEAVALDLRPAALPSRLVAAAIDAVVQVLLLVVLNLILAASLRGGLSLAGAAAVQIVFFVLALLGYPVAFESLWRGRTPGKAAMGLRVVRDDGGPVAFRQSLVRGLASLFLERPGITVFAGAVITSLLNRDSKRIGDLLAGTLVLQERVPTRLTAPVPMPPPLAGWAIELDLSGLPDDLAQAARSFVARSAELTDAAREELGGRLVAAVAAVTTPPPPPGTPGWAFLAAVLAERRRRAELRLAGPSPAAEALPSAPAPTTRTPATPTPATPTPATPTPAAPVEQAGSAPGRRADTGFVLPF